MKYQVGDEVLILQSNEEGKVIEILSDKMVMIEIRGVKFPAYMDQIDFPYFKRFSQSKLIPEKKKEKVFIDSIPKEKPQPNKITVSEGVWLSLIPKFMMDEFGDEVVDILKIYLVNKTSKGYNFIYTQEFNNNSNFDLKNQVTPFHDFYLHDISFEQLNDSPAFYFEFSLTNPEKKKSDFFEASLKLKPKQVFKKIEEIKEKNLPSITFQLFEEYPDKKNVDKFEISHNIQTQYKIYEANEIRRNLEPARSVIDLHIEKLTSDSKRMTNFEMLTMQLKEFEKWYDVAVGHHQQNLIVIHGVGTGKLRDEIHELLKTKNKVRFFINQYDPRYGYGATEIFFEYK